MRFALLFCLLCGTAAAELDVSHYCGEIGNQPVCMDLRIKGSSIVGVYFYKRYLSDIPLSGTIKGSRDLVLNEESADFNLHFEDKDPRGSFGNRKLDQEVATGSWSNGRERLPVYLAMTGSGCLDLESCYRVAGVEDGIAFEKKVQSFYKAVLNGNREAVARSLRYPLSVNLRKPPRLQSREELLAHYDAIFTPNWIACLKNKIPHRMFSNWQGVMLGSGLLWFDSSAKVIAVNPCMSLTEIN